MNIFQLPFIAVGYCAKSLLAIYYAATFTFSWLIIIGSVAGMLAAIIYGSGSIVPALLIVGILAAAGFLFWKLDN